MKKNIFFVGIKGVGMASLAVCLKQAGYEVEGSDVEGAFITDSILKKEAIPLHIGFNEEVIGKLDVKKTLLIYTGAHQGEYNSQVIAARNYGIEAVSYGEALGRCMSGELLKKEHSIGISVAASHGKTTISAMVATFLSYLNYDPSYVIGTSEIFPLGSAGHYGKGMHFVAEADEYATDPKSDTTPKFLYQHPQFAILNNIDFDHPDVFGSVEDVKEAFEQFVGGMPPKATVIINGDDQRLLEIKEKYGGTLHFITVGVGKGNDYTLERFHESGFNSFFSVESKEFTLGEFCLSVPGYHNAKNALTVIALLIELGVPVPKIQEVFPSFQGTKRRLEKIGKTNNDVEVLDDYAHHPEEIKATLNAVREAYPGKHILCVFQPHTVSRTRSLLSDFASSFTNADTLLLLPVFTSAREGEDDSIEAELKAKFESNQKRVIFSKEDAFVLEYIDQNVKRPDTVIVTMGAGNVYKIAEKLVSHL